MASLARAIVGLLVAQLAESVCIDAFCLTNISWAVGPANITFTGTCSALPLGNYPVTWCAFGISPSGLMVRRRSLWGPSGALLDDVGLSPLRLQFPAEAFMLQISDGAVVIEDRQNVGYVVPACYASQVSTVLSSTIGPNNSSFTATWTRCVFGPNLMSSSALGFTRCTHRGRACHPFCSPITLPSSLTQQGYLDIPTGPTRVLGAILYGIQPSYSNCSLTLIEHATASALNVTLIPA